MPSKIISREAMQEWLAGLRDKTQEDKIAELAWRRKIGHDQHAHMLSRILYPIAGIDKSFSHSCGAQFAFIEADGSRTCFGCGVTVKESEDAKTAA